MRYAASIVVATAALTAMPGCRAARQGSDPPIATASSDAAFLQVAHEYLDDSYRRQPTQATFLGIHTYDAKLDDYSRKAVEEAVAAAHQFRDRIARIDPALLSGSNQLDREMLLHAIDSKLLTLEVVRPWAKDPDTYSSGITNTAYIMIKRAFASQEERMRELTERERSMPAALAEARSNLENPPAIYTQIALEQVDGNRDFFRNDVPAAFPEVTDKALLDAFTAANNGVVAALAEYKQWMANDLKARSNGDFALGPDTYRKKLAADEMIDLPLDDLLAMAERDLRQNQAAFASTARQIDPAKPPMEVLAAIEHDHPRPDKLLSTTQSELDALARFMTDHHIVTIPKAAPAMVDETPPFMRSTTTASMDIPGPFERVATEAYYHVTLPDPKLSPAEVEDFMREWYYPLISNVSVHEVWPGHYLQFLYSQHLQSDVRKVFGANTNAEGWAHYCEQMILDEGFHADDPRYRLAELQDALLRDVRFIVGIRMHTKGMTVKEAEQLFEKEGYQPAPVARSEAKRGTSDPTYGYYTMGKLMILKLRDDYKAAKGAQFRLQDFHDTFISLGTLPLPLVRKAMLGETGRLF